MRVYQSSYSPTSSLYVRPVITLKPGIKVNEGDGSYNSPYVIDVSEVTGTPPEQNP